MERTAGKEAAQKSHKDVNAERAESVHSQESTEQQEAASIATDTIRRITEEIVEAVDVAKFHNAERIADLPAVKKQQKRHSLVSVAQASAGRASEPMVSVSSLDLTTGPAELPVLSEVSTPAAIGSEKERRSLEALNTEDVSELPANEQLAVEVGLEHTHITAMELPPVAWPTEYNHVESLMTARETVTAEERIVAELKAWITAELTPELVEGTSFAELLEGRTPEEAAEVEASLGTMLNLAADIDKLLTGGENPERAAELQAQLEVLIVELCSKLGLSAGAKTIQRFIARLQELAAQRTLEEALSHEEGTHEIKLDVFPGLAKVAKLFQIFDTHALIGRIVLKIGRREASYEAIHLGDALPLSSTLYKTARERLLDEMTLLPSQAAPVTR